MTDSNSQQICELDMEVILSEEDKTVYVKLSGFNSVEDADTYASYLVENLPLMLFDTEVKH